MERSLPGDAQFAVDAAEEAALVGTAGVSALADVVKTLDATVRRRDSEIMELKVALARRATQDGEVKGLEAEVSRLREELDAARRAELDRLRAENEHLRRVAVPVQPATAARAVPTGFEPPTYLISEYAKVADLLGTANVAAEMGQPEKAAQTRFEAAYRACEVLRQLADDQGFFRELEAVARYGEQHEAEVDAVIQEGHQFEEFRRVSLLILAVGGVPAGPAGELVDEARLDYLNDASPERRAAVTGHKIRRLRNAFCGEVKGEFKRSAQRARRRDDAVSAVVKGSGGIALVGIVGPLTAVSPILGAAASKLGGAVVDAASSAVRRG